MKANPKMTEAMEISKDLYMSSMEQGWQIVKASREAGMTPIFGGSPLQHGQAKLSEELAANYFRQRGFRVESPCIRADYSKGILSYDFLIHGHKLDIKSHIGLKPYVYVNSKQAHRSESDFYVFIEFGKLLQSAEIIGWLSKQEVLDSKLDKEATFSPAFKVRIEKLHMIEELEALLRLSHKIPPKPPVGLILK